MKRKLLLLLCLLCSATIFAEPATYSSVATGLILGPRSEDVPGNDHFAPPTSLNGTFSNWYTGIYGVKIPVALGDHPIFAGSYIQTHVDFTFTPVTASPSIYLKFSPLPFLSFSTGATIGAGWIFADELLVGMHIYDKDKKEYIASSAFSTMYYTANIQGNFQFDMAVFFPGDWNHIITTASYGISYSGLTSGGENGNSWEHLRFGSDKVNGLTYSASAMLGYAMPLALEIVGLQANFGGYFFEEDFNTESYDWDPTFMDISLNALAIVTIADNHSLTMLSGFSSRRSFDTTYADEVPMFDKKTVGREWYFNGITMIYTYNF